MTQATRPKSDSSATAIGEAIDQLSNGAIDQATAEQTILANVERPGGHPDVTNVDFVPDPHKYADSNLESNIAVIVPDSEVVNTMREIHGDGSTYTISQTYLSLAARQLLRETGEDADRLLARVKQLDGEAPGGDNLYHFLMGDYAVKRCW